ncbi:hypothetical protein AALP_AA8G320000 [Arabis alpina]|uniref:Growth-regulating factor n=1 Tax=Arabis alpina TaxID=50452 RepID=A0A087GAT8_ARAAL|nr:hypothetical protein AALP_AA8G320000 [Arabis alpina]
MDFLKVSDKTTTIPCTSDSLFGLNEQQFGFRDMEIHPPHPHLITPYAGNGVLGCYYYYPFTNAQLKELERQAMIYKYMIASVPVPFDLLISSSSSSSVSPCNNKNIAGDLEPGRCRRTDGKKWRCSKEVVSNHKYCERHLHRGRPRSRKHVEPPYSRPINNNGASEKNRNFPQKLSVKEPKEVSISSSLSNYKESRAKTEEENKYLNFIDIWSEKRSTTSTPVSSSNGNLSLYSLDLSMGGGGNNLMGHDEMGLIQMGLGIIGSGREDPYGVSSLEEMSSWLAPKSATPGGPLAEILRPNPSFVFSGGMESYSVTATATPSSSPSRVVKKINGSVSDESSHI